MEVGHGPLPRSTPHSIDRQILTHLHRNKILSQVEIPVYVSGIGIKLNPYASCFYMKTILIGM